MNVLFITYFINGFLMIAMPISLAIFITRKFSLQWRLFWVGAGTFIFSQVLHIPFNAYVGPLLNQPAFTALPVATQTAISAGFLGLSAGLFEELSRYCMYRWVAKDARSWGKGLLAGIGHGGAEAIILGVLFLYGYIQLIALRTVDLSTVVPAAQLDLARAQVTTFWSTPWYQSMLGAVERLFTIPLHLALSLLVMQAFTRKQFWWVGLAILLHAASDGTAVFASGMQVPVLWIEGIIGLFAVVSVAIIFALRQPEPNPNLPASQPVIVPEFIPQPLEPTDENLDQTRYR